jgi:hypothetical protein
MEGSALPATFEAGEVIKVAVKSVGAIIGVGSE